MPDTVAAPPAHETCVINRAWALAGDGEWTLIAAPGEYPAKVGDRRILQVIDREAIEAMARNHRGELLVDYDHLSHDLSQPTAAAGWITELDAREDGLYARMRWSGRGRSDLEAGNYRFVSPEFPVSAMHRLGGDRHRPTVLSGAALTNRPNMRTLPPLANRGAAAAPTTEPVTMDITTIITALGLPAETAEDTVLNRIRELSEAARARDELQTRCTELESSLQTARNRLAEADLAPYHDIIPEADRPKVRELLSANREGTLAVLHGARALASTRSPAGEALATNRKPTPPDGSPSPRDRDRLQKAKVEQIRTKNRCTHKEAWDIAMREDPELFAEPAAAEATA